MGDDEISNFSSCKEFVLQITIKNEKSIKRVIVNNFTTGYALFVFKRLQSNTNGSKWLSTEYHLEAVLCLWCRMK